MGDMTWPVCPQWVFLYLCPFLLLLLHLLLLCGGRVLVFLFHFEWLCLTICGLMTPHFLLLCTRSNRSSTLENSQASGCQWLPPCSSSSCFFLLFLHLLVVQAGCQAVWAHVSLEEEQEGGWWEWWQQTSIMNKLTLVKPRQVLYSLSSRRRTVRVLRSLCLRVVIYNINYIRKEKEWEEGTFKCTKCSFVFYFILLYFICDVSEETSAKYNHPCLVYLFLCKL